MRLRTEVDGAWRRRLLATIADCTRILSPLLLLPLSKSLLLLWLWQLLCCYLRVCLLLLLLLLWHGQLLLFCGFHALNA